ncbi:methyltransferase-like protein 27 [Cololabis saira]|uniref:methyltransferase-like protein 27 n=1 Tax=Cololabis saira TaxID=129043 RepID=UPI002AD3851C|nr:methyltransferase-like protein 27 [Cololabis saira]
MSAMTSFEHVKAVISSAHKCTTSEEKVNFYNTWANNYDQDVAVLDYRAPSLATNSILSQYSGRREAAAVFDVACGTGLVAKQMKKHGFARFVGVDGSQAMLDVARESGLYQDLQQFLLGEEPLPAHWECVFDVVVIVGALSVGQVPVGVARDLCKASKSGGLICMTTRSNCGNLEYKAALESELRKMEEEGLWTCVEVTEVDEWERGVSAQEEGYISGAVYLYKRL